jgi:hypothetical protein
MKPRDVLLYNPTIANRSIPSGTLELQQNDGRKLFSYNSESVVAHCYYDKAYMPIFSQCNKQTTVVKAEENKSVFQKFI